MLSVTSSQQLQEIKAKLEAIGKSQAVIEFRMDGTIITANQNFLNTMGYTLEEIRNKHHSMFADPAYAASAEYKKFWENLNKGQFSSGEFRRLAKGGRDVWLQATYTPILNASGRPVKVVKFASDITKQKLQNADFAGQISAISKSQAVIEFNPDGTIITANGNFLHTVGYSLDEIRGKHHSMFMPEDEKDSPAYETFWTNLRKGEYQAGEYKRIGKNGREIWLQASYNPIFDSNGKPFKFVKYAIEVTSQKLKSADSAGQIEAIGKSLAVIEFDMNGNVLTANDVFLNTMGYSLGEIKGRNHSMFVHTEMRESMGYREFWNKLRRGEYQSGEYKRMNKAGQDVYIQGSYNPIFDLNGHPYKVVKFASDVTQQTLARIRNEMIRNMMESVAAGAVELSASVKELAGNMGQSREETNHAFQHVMDADKSTQQLNEAASAMGNVVEIITGITAQIKLLALNATIESARAGEAGKGFAVVANEVRNLAAQAKDATDKIAGEINGMRNISDQVITSLSLIRGSISSVRQHVLSCASAMEQQNVVANEMSSSMQKAAAEAAQTH